MRHDASAAERFRSAYKTADTIVAGAMGGFVAYWVVCMIFLVTLGNVLGSFDCNPDVAPCYDSPGGMMALMSTFLACTAGMPAGICVALPGWRVNVRPMLAAAALTFAASAVLTLSGVDWVPDLDVLVLALMGPLQVLAAVGAWLVRRSRESHE